MNIRKLVISILGIILTIAIMKDNVIFASEKTTLKYTEDSIEVQTVPRSYYTIETYYGKGIPTDTHLYQTSYSSYVNESGEASINRNLVDGSRYKRLHIVNKDQNLDEVIDLEVRDKSPLNIEIENQKNIEKEPIFVTTKENTIIKVFVNGSLVEERYNEYYSSRFFVSNLTPGDKVIIKVEDIAGNKKESEELIVTPIINGYRIPFYSSYTDNMKNFWTYVDGDIVARAEIKNEKNEVIGKGTVKDNQLNIEVPTQKVGSTISVVGYDKNGYTSKVGEMKVVDGTSPIKPQLNTILDSKKVVSGKGEPGTEVKIYKPKNEYQLKLLAKGKVNAQGNFSVKVKAMVAGDTLHVKLIDLAGNRSDASISKVLDRTAPMIPKVNAINQTSKTVTGTGEPNAKVYVYKGSKLIGSAIVNKDGQFFAKITMQKKKTVLSVSSMDRAGNESKERKVIVQ